MELISRLLFGDYRFQRAKYPLGPLNKLSPDVPGFHTISSVPCGSNTIKIIVFRDHSLSLLVLGFTWQKADGSSFF